LPFGKGKRFANRGGVVNALVGGWQFAGVQTYKRLTPLSVGSQGWDSGIFAGNLGASARPNIVAGKNFDGYSGGGWKFGESRRLNPAAFTVTPKFSFGNAPRALGVREFATHDEDLNISKQIPLYTDRMKAVFRVEFFNAFNRAGQYTGFTTQVGSDDFGHASDRQNSPRSIQGNLRVSF
jgi:hypothetical protein